MSDHLCLWYDENGDIKTCGHITGAGIEALRKHFQNWLREDIAREIEAAKVPLSGLIHDLAFNDAIRLAAKIARGQNE